MATKSNKNAPKKQHTEEYNSLLEMPTKDLKKEVKRLRKQTLQRYSRLAKKYEYTPALSAYRKVESKFKGKKLSDKNEELITTYNILKRLLENKTSTIRGAEKFKQQFEAQFLFMQNWSKEARKEFFDAYDKFISHYQDGSKFKYDLWQVIFDYMTMPEEYTKDVNLEDTLKDVLDELMAEDIPD